MLRATESFHSGNRGPPSRVIETFWFSKHTAFHGSTTPERRISRRFETTRMTKKSPRSISRPSPHFFEQWSVLLAYLILIFGILAVYWPLRGFEFTNFDDPAYVTNNEHVKKDFTLDGVKWAFRSYESGNWHPLTWFSHMLDCQLYGINPGGHHVTNLLFHIFNFLPAVCR
jgi:hypothetical protein